MSYSPEIAKLAEFLQKECKFDQANRFRNIYDIDNLFRTWSNYVRRESFFNRYPEMTNHGIEHVENVVSIIAQICLPLSDIAQENRKDQAPLLNRSEVFCLAAAGWLHDIGMYVTGNDPESDDPDLVRDVHGRLSMEKIILEREVLFPGCSEADVRLIGSILAYHQSKAPFDLKAKKAVIEKRLNDGKPSIPKLWAQTEVISEIVPARTLACAPVWKAVSGGAKLDPETLMKVDFESGEVSTSVPRVRKPEDKYEQKPVVTRETAGDRWNEWVRWLRANKDNLWGLQFAPEGERVDPQYLAAILAIADQTDVQVARSGNMEFMVRQLDRGHSRHQTITSDITKVRGTDRWSKKENAGEGGAAADLEILEIIKAVEIFLNQKAQKQSGLENVKKILENIKAWTREKKKESEYLSNGYIHFMPNLVIARALVVMSETRRDQDPGYASLLDGEIKKSFIDKLRNIKESKDALLSYIFKKLSPETQKRIIKGGAKIDHGQFIDEMNANIIDDPDFYNPRRIGRNKLTDETSALADKKNRSKKENRRLNKLLLIGLYPDDFSPKYAPLELASFEENKKLPEAHRDPVMQVVLVPNDIRRLINDLKMISERGYFGHLIDKLDDALTKNEKKLIGCAGSYIAGELNRVQYILDKRPTVNGKPLSFAVYKYDRDIDGRALPFARERFRGDLPRPGLDRQDGFKLVERVFNEELAEKIAFDNPDSPRTLIAYGPPGSGRKTAVYQLARKLAGGDRKLIFWYELERDRKRDRSEDQVTDLIRQLAYFMSCNGEFALDNALRDAEFITEYHKKFALECLRRSYHKYVVCLIDLNCVNQRNREFFKKLANREAPGKYENNQETRILAVSTQYPMNRWIAASEKDVKMLRFSSMVSETCAKEAEKKKGLWEFSDEWHVCITKGEVEAVWTQLEKWFVKNSTAGAHPPGIETSRKNQSARMKSLWAKMGYYPIFVDFLSDIVRQCNFDTLWLYKRMKAAMMGHVEEVTSLLGSNDPQKGMAAYLSHLVSNENFEAKIDDAVSCEITDPVEQLLALEARALIDFVPKPDRAARELKGSLFMHPAWVRRYSDGDKSVFIPHWRKRQAAAKALIDGGELIKLGFDTRDVGKLLSAFTKASGKDKEKKLDRAMALAIAREFAERTPRSCKNIGEALEEFIGTKIEKPSEEER